MAWPTESIVTTAMDEATDDPSVARAEIKKMADAINSMIAAYATALGVASLGAGGTVPLEQLPTIPANKGGTGQTSYSVGDLLFASSSSALSKLSAGTSGFVLTSNGPGVAPSWQQAGGGLTSGVRMLFQNTNAPTGWTKETNAAFNNVALRIVTGSVSNGGAEDFTTIFGTGKATNAYTLSVGDIPSHGHTQRGQAGGIGGGNTSMQTLSVTTVSLVNSSATTLNAGGGGSHSHTLSLDIKYRDFIIATKD